MLSFHFITLFPDIINAYSDESILMRAIKAQKIEVVTHDLRQYATDKHRTVDDRVYGGGPGMLLKIDVLFSAISDIKKQLKEKNLKSKVILFSAHGQLFTQEKAEHYSKSEENTALIFICGHYEGVDARIREFVDEELSVGPYVLTGGELPSLVVMDAITRLLPGVLGNEDSAQAETNFSIEDNSLIVDGEHPQYTRPEVFAYIDETGTEQTLSVPTELLSGHHKNIETFNQRNRKREKIILS